MGRLFITGFGPFGQFDENPSETLVRSLDEFCTEILPVTFDAVDAFVGRGLPKGHDKLLMLGACPRGRLLRIERYAKNAVGERPDIQGCVRGPSMIDPAAEKRLRGSLFAGWGARGEGWRSSYDAGSYLCNYIYFEALRRLEGVRCGFIHVPPFSAASRKIQDRALREIIATRLSPTQT